MWVFELFQGRSKNSYIGAHTLTHLMWKAVYSMINNKTEWLRRQLHTEHRYLKVKAHRTIGNNLQWDVNNMIECQLTVNIQSKSISYSLKASTKMRQRWDGGLQATKVKKATDKKNMLLFNKSNNLMVHEWDFSIPQTAQLWNQWCSICGFRVFHRSLR